MVDASNVPSKYILTILSECATFPRRLIFFVKGSFGVSLIRHGYQSPPLPPAFLMCCLFCLCNVLMLLSCVSGMQQSHHGVLRCADLLLHSGCVYSASMAVIMFLCDASRSATMTCTAKSAAAIDTQQKLQVYQPSLFASSKLLMLLSVETPCSRLLP